MVRPIWTRLDGPTLSVWTALLQPPAGIQSASLVDGLAQLSLTNLSSYLTNYIQRSFNLAQSGSWTNVGVLTGIDGAGTWSEPLPPTNAFYRVRSY